MLSQLCLVFIPSIVTQYNDLRSTFYSFAFQPTTHSFRYLFYWSPCSPFTEYIEYFHFVSRWCIQQLKWQLKVFHAVFGFTFFMVNKWKEKMLFSMFYFSRNAAVNAFLLTTYLFLKSSFHSYDKIYILSLPEYSFLIFQCIPRNSKNCWASL